MSTVIIKQAAISKQYKRTASAKALSEYQLEILKRSSIGYRYKEIADHLGVTKASIEDQVERMREWFDCASMIELVARCIRLKIIE